jgi:hypothetical protein
MAVPYTNNSITPWTTTTFNSSLYYFSDSQPVCVDTTSFVSNNRPLTRFTFCPIAPDSNLYSYSWSPSGGLSDSFIKNPIASPTSSTVYYITVTDTLGGCSTTDSVFIAVDPCTYIDESGQSFDIGIYPNPNTGYFTISKPKELYKLLEFKLLNTLGENVLKGILPNNENSTNIDISSLSNGIYFINLTIGKKVITKKIIKY